MPIFKIMKNWRKVNLGKIKYHYELYLEDRNCFKYPVKGLNKYSVDVFNLIKINRLFKETNKLHVGCGFTKIKGFINIDAFKTDATDFVCYIQDLPKYIRSNSVKLIYASHIIEHFSRKDSIEVLKMFYDFLTLGGELRISVPDLLRLSEIVKYDNLEFQDMDLAQGILLGGQDTRYNYHKSIYWYSLMKKILLSIGFKVVSEFPGFPHFLGDVQDAASMAKVNQVHISLNVKAVK
jgi:predicted SAM-dependent methyltransferase